MGALGNKCFHDLGSSTKFFVFIAFDPLLVKSALKDPGLLQCVVKPR